LTWDELADFLKLARGNSSEKVHVDRLADDTLADDNTLADDDKLADSALADEEKSELGLLHADTVGSASTATTPAEKKAAAELMPPVGGQVAPFERSGIQFLAIFPKFSVILGTLKKNMIYFFPWRMSLFSNQRN
jgi:hypothetical protein